MEVNTMLELESVLDPYDNEVILVYHDRGHAPLGQSHAMSPERCA